MIMDQIMIEGAVEHYVEGKANTEIIKFSEQYNKLIEIDEYRLRFEKLVAEKFKSKWADTIELSITRVDHNGTTVLNHQLPESKTPLRTVLYPRSL